VEISGHGRRITVTRLHEWDANRNVDDWNGWTKATTIPAAVLGQNIEFEIDWDLLISPKVAVYAYAQFQSYDSEVDEADYVLASTGPSLVVAPEPTVASVLAGADQELLRLHLRCHIATCSYSSITVRLTGTAGFSVATVVRLRDGLGGLLRQVTPTTEILRMDTGPRSLEAGSSETLVVSADVSGSGGGTLGATVARADDVTISGGAVTVRDVSAPRSVGYVGIVPSGIRIDGGFADWTNPALDASEVGRLPDVDLQEYAFSVDAGSAALYLSVAGRAFNGTLVPAENAEVPSLVPAPADSDRDTVPDAQDPFPIDFNNDGIIDAATTSDYDGDAIQDYPAGSDWYLNTTVPSNFPPPYANQTVSLFIGPTSRPQVLGEDVWRVFFDADNNSATGFRVNVLGADYLAEIRGKFGTVTYRTVSDFTGSSPWSWTWNPLASIPAAVDHGRLEAGFATAGLGLTNASAAYFEVMDWARIPDGPVDPAFRIGGAGPSSMSDRSPQPGVVTTLDLAGNEKWFFTDTNGNEAVCGVNKDASTTAGVSATSVTMSTQGSTACWYSPDGVPDTVAGVWEVILDIETVSAGTEVFSPSALGDVNAWTVSGTSGCNSEGNEERCVDETTNDGDATYVKSTSGSQTDSLYNIPDWTAPSPLSVTNLQLEASCRKTTGATVSVAILIKSGGTVFVGGSGGQDCVNSATYSVWTDSWTTDPFDGGAWTNADINALQVGVRDGDSATDEVRASHVKVAVTYTPVYSVEINECTNSACSGSAIIYAATNFNGYGPDVTIQTGTIGARSMTGGQHVQWKISLVSGGSIRIRYNGPHPGADDSRATVPIPELEQVVVAIGVAVVVAIVSRRWRLRRIATADSLTRDAWIVPRQ